MASDKADPGAAMQLPPIEEYRERARAWLAENLEPLAAPRASRSPLLAGDDKDRESIRSERLLQRKLYEGGYAGISWPAEYGGQGLTKEHEAAFDEEARRYRLPDFGIAGGTSFGVCAMTMLAHASPEFLRLHIPRMLAGDELFVQFFSDPEAGSDLAGVRTQAVKDGDRWILNGSKIWSSGAYYADWGMCLARTDWDVPKHRGLTWFAVPIDAKGVTVERIKQINGDAEFCQEFFDDVELSDADVIGEVNDGWTVTQTMLYFERGGGVTHGTPRVTFGAGIAADLVQLAESAGRLDDPLVRDLIASSHIDDVARSALVVRLVSLMAKNPQNAANVASYAKLASGIHDPKRASTAMVIGGTHSVAWDQDGVGSATATGFLSSRFLSIAGGTNQMQRNGIGERVLGLPREPSFDRDKPFREVLRDAKSWSGRSG